MIYIEKNNIIGDTFEVIDEDDNPVTGLIKGDFTIKLYNPNENNVADISGGIPITFSEVGDGLYRLYFTPDQLGNWELLVYHTTYFPVGKGENYTCVNSLGGVSQEVEDMIRRTLGLCHENFRTFEEAYDRNNNLIGSVVKIYDSAADVETDTNPIATYQMSAVFNLRSNQLDGYKFKRLT